MHIRAVRNSDIPRITGIYNHYVRETVVTFEEQEVPEKEMTRRIAGITAMYPFLVAEEPEGVLGYAYASRFKERAAYRHTAETTVYLSPDAAGRGIGTILYENLLAELAVSDLHRLMAVIALPNPASVRLHEKLGFTRRGLFTEVGRKFGRWIDVGYWERPVGKTLPGPL